METLLQFKNPQINRLLIQGHNPYFSGNSFAIEATKFGLIDLMSHNPYFSGNSFAMESKLKEALLPEMSQSLF